MTFTFSVLLFPCTLLLHIGVIHYFCSVVYDQFWQQNKIYFIGTFTFLYYEHVSSTPIIRQDKQLTLYSHLQQFC